jgi:hypothetical protein
LLSSSLPGISVGDFQSSSESNDDKNNLDPGSHVTPLTDLPRLIPPHKIGFSYVVFEVLTAVVMKCSVLWYMTPCSPFSTALFATCFTLVSSLAYSSILKMVATCYPEPSVDFQRTTWCYIPEDRPLAFSYVLSNIQLTYNSSLP